LKKGEGDLVWKGSKKEKADENLIRSSFVTKTEKEKEFRALEVYLPVPDFSERPEARSRSTRTKHRFLASDEIRRVPGGREELTS